MSTASTHHWLDHAHTTQHSQHQHYSTSTRTAHPIHPILHPIPPILPNIQTFLGSPLKLWASVGHWAIWHFSLEKFTEKQRPRVLVSLAACALFAFGALPALTYYTGLAGLAKYWWVSGP